MLMVSGSHLNAGLLLPTVAALCSPPDLLASSQKRAEGGDVG